MKGLVPLTVAARLMGVQRCTLWRMVQAGEVDVVRTTRTPRGRIYVTRAWLVRVLGEK